MLTLFGGDYMIPACWDGISARSGGTDFTLRFHVEVQFRTGKAGEFSTLYCLDLQAFSLNFSLFEFFYSSAVSILFHKVRSSRLQMFFKIDVLKIFAVFSRKH